MNALALWIPGTALIVVGVVLFATGRVETTWALAIIIVGGALETAGLLLWVRQRRAQQRSSR
jgi:hypothetical protein